MCVSVFIEKLNVFLRDVCVIDGLLMLVCVIGYSDGCFFVLFCASKWTLGTFFWKFIKEMSKKLFWFSSFLFRFFQVFVIKLGFFVHHTSLFLNSMKCLKIVISWKRLNQIRNCYFFHSDFLYIFVFSTRFTIMLKNTLKKWNSHF